MIRKIVKDPNRRPLRSRHRAQVLTGPAEYLFSKWAQDVHKTLQDTYKVAQEPHMTPEDDPRGLEDHPETDQDTSKTAQDPPKTAQGASKTRCFDFRNKNGAKLTPKSHQKAILCEKSLKAKK